MKEKQLSDLEVADSSPAPEKEKMYNKWDAVNWELARQRSYIVSTKKDTKKIG